MTPQISVVIVSRARGPDLARCLLSLSFQTCPDFEVIVVGDRAAQQAVIAGPGLARVGFVPFEELNIAAARNAGMAAARAPLVAFLDDDAVAEPCWLDGLRAALQDPGIALAAGYVRGPDGLAFQWCGEWLSPWGLSRAMDPAPETSGPVKFEGDEVPGAMGTSFAVRRASAQRIGGFDPRFRYYLEDSDLVLRLAAAGHGIAYAPRAQVHHNLAAGPYRCANRVPRSLFEIGRSAAHFTQTHAAEAATVALAAHRARQRARLLRAMVAGHCLPDQVWSLLRSFDRGAQAANRGAEMQPAAEPVQRAKTTFLPHSEAQSRPKPLWLVARGQSDIRAFADAEKAVEERRVVSVLVPVGRFARARVSFREPGLWIHEIPVITRQSTADRRIVDKFHGDYTDIRVVNKL